VYTTHEYPGGELRAYDLNEPSSPEYLGFFSADPTATVHNAYVVDQALFVSHYSAGATVFDLTDPMRPILDGRVDTLRHDHADSDHALAGDTGWVHEHSTGPSGMNGCWGLYPEGSHVVATDMVHGLFVLDYFPHLVVP
jgi:hypothetical protein